MGKPLTMSFASVLRRSAAVAALLLAASAATAQTPAPTPTPTPAPTTAAPPTATPSAAPANAQTIADALKLIAGQSADGVVARIDQIDVKRSDLAKLLVSLPPQVQQLPLESVYPLLLDRLIDQRLVTRAARAEKLTDDPDVKRRLVEAEDQILQQVYLDRTLRKQVTDTSLRARYDQLVKDNPPQEEVRARHILVATEKAARDIVAELAKGADFSAVAKAKSSDSSAREGGDLGYFTEGDMVPEFSAAAFKLKPNEWTREPVKSQYGWHVIKVEDRRKTVPPKFEDVKDQLASEASQEMIGDVIEKLRGKAKIERFGLDGKPVAATPGPTPTAPAK